MVGPRQRLERGFTVVELLISLLVFSVVMAVALSFLRVQSEGFKKGLDYMSTIQTLRYAVGTLEQDIQTAGTNLVAGQPEVVYADEDVVAFNADYASRKGFDPFSVFFDPDLKDRATRTWLKKRRREIPLSSFIYPDTTYLDDTGLPGPAETLIFFFVPDDATARDDDYALFRQVNAEAPQMVANHLLRSDGEPFFRYMKENSTGIDSISDNILPIAHEVATHESPGDTGRAALVDSIRAVRVTMRATNGKEGDRERTSQITRLIRMPNMGFGRLEICGSPPILGTGLDAALGQAPDTGEPMVTLTWVKATDEAGGEKDIVRYVIWRREPGLTDWEEPYLSIPAGEASYIYVDADLEPGKTYEYALATQDCTPTLSPLVFSTPISIPKT